MKKLVLLLAVAFSATMFSCGSADKAENAADTVVAAVEEVVLNDTLANDTVVTDTVVAAAVAAE